MIKNTIFARNLLNARCDAFSSKLLAIKIDSIVRYFDLFWCGICLWLQLQLNADLNFKRFLFKDFFITILVL